MQQKVIIVGGGFGGIRTALDLAGRPGFDITLISKNPNFEYYPGLHKMLGISNHVTVQIPLATIFKNKEVSVVIDNVTSVDPVKKEVVTSGGTYSGDFLVLAIGSQTEYFGIPGVQEIAYGFKSVAEAQKLRDHIQELFEKHTTTEKAETLVSLHMLVVGAGPNGVDLAGELAAFTKQLAKKHSIAESFITIDLVEAGPRILGMMPEEVSKKAADRLRALGVNILCNRDLRKDESWTVTMADMSVGARTLIWTAGISTNDLVTKIPGFALAKRNRVIVDEFLQPKNGEVIFKDVFCIGDIADTQYAGLAQTALADGEYVAQVIARECAGKKPRNYSAHPVAYNIGVGPRWSVLIIGTFKAFGIIPYILRTLIDIRFFLSILPVAEVWNLYMKKSSNYCFFSWIIFSIFGILLKSSRSVARIPPL